MASAESKIPAQDEKVFFTTLGIIFAIPCDLQHRFFVLF